jgi:hypothetical protein
MMEAEPSPYHYRKQRLPEGESYPLKRSDLDTALSAASVPRQLAVQLIRSRGRLVATASLVPDHLRLPTAGTCVLYIHSVPAAVRHEVRTGLLGGGGLRRLVDWIEACGDAAPTWRMQRRQVQVHYRAVQLGDEGVLRFAGDFDVLTR